MEEKKCPAGGFKTMCGGQALIEGILMRGPKKQSIVIRRPDGGLEIREKELKLIKDRYPILGWPLIRGVVTFLDSMVEGVKALMFSAEFYPEDGEEPEEPSKFEQWLDEHLGSEKVAAFFTTVAVVIGIAMSIYMHIILETEIYIVRLLLSEKFPSTYQAYWFDGIIAPSGRRCQPKIAVFRKFRRCSRNSAGSARKYEMA